MLYMNECEIQLAASRYRDHPVLGPATRTLGALVDWTNSNSDGWPYWSKPCRAARQLQELIGDTSTMLRDPERSSVTREQLERAYRPIKSFRTRHGADFQIHLP